MFWVQDATSNYLLLLLKRIWPHIKCSNKWDKNIARDDGRTRLYQDLALPTQVPNLLLSPFPILCHSISSTILLKEVEIVYRLSCPYLFSLLSAGLPVLSNVYQEVEEQVHYMMQPYPASEEHVTAAPKSAMTNYKLLVPSCLQHPEPIQWLLKVSNDD